MVFLKYLIIFPNPLRVDIASSLYLNYLTFAFSFFFENENLFEFFFWKNTNHMTFVLRIKLWTTHYLSISRIRSLKIVMHHMNIISLQMPAQAFIARYIRFIMYNIYIYWWSKYHDILIIIFNIKCRSKIICGIFFFKADVAQKSKFNYQKKGIFYCHLWIKFKIL